MDDREEQGSRSGRLLVCICSLAVAFFCFSASADAAGVKFLRSIPNSGGNPSPQPFTVAPDDTIYEAYTTASNTEGPGVVVHLDDHGNDLGDGFDTNRNVYPLSIAVSKGRVLLATPVSFSNNQIDSWNLGGGDLFYTDSETGSRFGSVQMIMNAFGGNITLGFGQSNKIAELTLKTTESAAHPLYPQGFYGQGINDGADAWEGCVVGIPAAKVPCGTQGGRGGTALGDLNYPEDVVPGPHGKTYVLESFAPRITVLAPPNSNNNTPHPVGFIANHAAGSGAAQLNHPDGMVIDKDGNLYVSDQSNSRISEYNSKTGKFVRAIGYGVKDGVNKLETCTTTCQAGNPSSPMYYPGHLAIDSNGNLYVGAGSSISVFSVTGGVSKTKVRLAASPIKVEKGHRTTLTGSIEPCSGANKKGKILFQTHAGGGWDNLGHAVKVDGKCKASVDEKIEKKTEFRAVAIDKNENTLDTSSTVTVKVK